MINVEHLGIDFGLRKGAVCTSCGDEYISDEVWEEIEKKAKELGLFGLEIIGLRSRTKTALG